VNREAPRSTGGRVNREAATDTVLWHDLECGAYRADLPLWRELAALTGGPILDIGAGTGRVALELARRGYEVVALDIDAALLAELERRAAGLPVRTVVADARAIDLADRFPLILVPMQTIQLLPTTEDRVALLRGAAAHLAPGGRFAAALADALEGFDADHDEPPVPDVLERDGWVYASQPLRVTPGGGAATIERERSAVSPTGVRSATLDRVRLADLDAPSLEAEAALAGLRPAGRRRIAPTDDHVGSQVVILSG
jgi:SAM-dependent methyltransferase